MGSREQTNLLVLGVGGNVSQGILKALALSKLSCRVIGACVSSLSFGLYTVDKAYISPYADDPSFLDWLINLCRRENVAGILSGVEPILKVLACHAQVIQAQTKAIPIVSSPECLAIGNDKLHTCQWLSERGFAYPKHASIEDLESVNKLVTECGYPLIAKPRFGKGSHGIVEVHNDQELQLIRQRSGYVLQEFLGDASEEYTAGCFSDSDGKARGAIVMRRDLMAGTTYRAQVVQFPSVRAEAIRIAESLGPKGPCNVQMRLHRGVPTCFEINVRFSGTTPMRARLGFNDVELAVNHYVLGQPAEDLPLVTKGVALRYWNEAYIDPDAAAELERTSQLEKSSRSHAVVEDYGLRS